MADGDEDAMRIPPVFLRASRVNVAHSPLHVNNGSGVQRLDPDFQQYIM
jgi:hypothetical protein